MSTSDEEEPHKATPAVWRKRLLQVPVFGFNHRAWTIGVSWHAPEDEGFFCLHFLCFGLMWDLWP